MNTLNRSVQNSIAVDQRVRIVTHSVLGPRDAIEIQTVVHVEESRPEIVPAETLQTFAPK
jgi:hypothetical protein